MVSVTRHGSEAVIDKMDVDQVAILVLIKIKMLTLKLTEQLRGIALVIALVRMEQIV